MKQNLIIVGSIIIAAVLIGMFVRGRSNKTPEMPKEGISDIAVSESIKAKEETSDLNSGESMMKSTTEKLLPYSPETLQEALKDGTDVLFFHAGWCPTCIAAEKDFRANLDQIPENITIIKANYDTETELKAKYGVVTQDTFVQIDGQGEVIAKWNSGGKGMQTLLKNIR
ncbi:MAG: thioredoxin family protein [bacterium]|nr:thioredoxin family protein [bacterium]